MIFSILSIFVMLLGCAGAWDKGEDKGKDYDDIFVFTSTYKVWATPQQVVNMTNGFTGGLAGAKGLFKYGINSDENTICYNITLKGFRGNYSSPAFTATHIHAGTKGLSGPPRIALPNPIDIGNDFRRSAGCLKGPFRTGINGTNGSDTGVGFHVKQIEDNPAGFFTDVHSTLAVPGAVRGQLDSDFDYEVFF
ncbi:unnamed protein product [Discula destructiva]